MNIEIANRLQQLRKEKGYSQEQLADELGISRQAVSKWERAESSPDTDNLICLAKLYGVSLDSLLATDDSIEDIKEEQMIKKESIDANKENDCDELTPKQKKIIGIVSSITALSLTFIYLLIGAVWSLWHPGWILFMLIPVVVTLTEAIMKRNPHSFAFPILVSALYLFFSFEFMIWHPLWVIFLTIPIYYTICNIFKNEDE